VHEAWLERRTQELGTLLLSRARERSASFWARQRWESALVQKLMADAHFRVQALRFIDVLPQLSDDADLVGHLQEYFSDQDLPLPDLARWSIDHAGQGLPARLLAGAVRVAMHGLAARFMGGTSAEDAYGTAQSLRRRGMAFSLDVLGEAVVSESEADGYQRQYLDLLEHLCPRVARWDPLPLLDTVARRPCPRVNLSVKLSSLDSQLVAQDPEGGAERVKGRLRPLLAAARTHGAFVCLDMEHYQTRHVVLRVLREVLMEPEFRDWPDAGIALQAYLREAEADLEEILAWAERRGTPVTVRLVRGAYWDYETVVARQHGWPVPVWTDKGETDRCYERCLLRLSASYPGVETAVATHNVRSLALAMAVAEHRGLPKDAWEIQMLYGMADPLKDTVVEMGHRLRVYVPFGEILPGMAYLVRRLLENTASQSFLRLGFMEDAPAEVLLAAPEEPAAGASADSSAPPSQTSLGPFRNEPVHRFTAPEERSALAHSLDRVRSELGRDYPLIVGDQEATTGNLIASVNPARPSELIGRVACADQSAAARAVEAARSAFPEWRDLSARERAEFLLRTAELLRLRRDELAAWEILEAGKGWTEADADVAEAIDYLEYYAREALRLEADQSFDVPGEANRYFYQPRGVGVVIAPWNFPLAILTGMLSACLAAGNTAIVKPSSQTPVVAARLVGLLREAGVPEGVVNFLPGRGAEVGDFLVQHPEVDLVAFTGSREVGTRIFRLAAEVGPGQRHLKRVIAEMGGKNAIIVDTDADLDDAVLGTVASAFGYQGQKCSAASRVIAVGGAYERFLGRLVEAVRSLPIGPPEDPGTFMGPLIEAAAVERVRRAIEAGKRVARPVLEMEVSHLGEGFYLGPAVFADVPPESALAQEEIFGPVLALMQAPDLESALALANGSAYALTGGIYSRLPSHLARAAREFRVGNLYLNRKITGAMVGRQPFGGFKMSGVGSKAGGPDYLLQFLEPRTVTESTLRRGFAPDE
jgi:RHH-type proline utilization regulon transcriptional repressor/proline dehydrogenase/delta 1-pyrroline-5-carboxylate dehydrogenase